MKLRYKLTEDEINEVLLCLNWKKEGRLRDINMIIISILGVVILGLYMKNPGQFFLAALLALIILLLFYMAYGPAVSRKKKGKKMAEDNGEYRVEINQAGIVYGDDHKKMNWNGKKIKCLESKQLTLIQMEREVFAIPKRILTAGEQSELRMMLEQQNCDRISIAIK